MEADVEVDGERYSLGGEPEIPFPFVVGRLNERIYTGKLSSDAVVYIPFLLLFCFFAYGGRQHKATHFLVAGDPFGVEQAYYTTRALQDVVRGNEIDGYQVTKVYDDIGNAGDWYGWFETVLVPNLYGPCGPGESSAPTGVRTLGGLNYLLGAMRIRTQRASNASCSLDPGIFGADPNTGELLESVKESSPCYGRLDGDEETQVRYGFPNGIADPGENSSQPTLYTYATCAELPGGQSMSGYLRTYDCGGYYIDVRFDEPCFAAEWIAEKMDPDGPTPFFDNVQTRFISIEFFTYTPSHDSFTSVKLFAEVAAGGAWLPQYQVRNFQVWTSKSIGQTFLDFFFFAFVLYFVREFIAELQAHRHSAREGSIMRFIFKPWNFIELCNLLCFMVVFGFRWAWWDVSMQSDQVSFPFPKRYPSDLDRLLTYYSMQRYGNSINVVITFLKSLKYLSLNPRLGVLTAAIDNSKIEIGSTMIIFVWIIFAYAMSGHGIFGTSMWEFHTIEISFSTLLRLTVGDYSMVEHPNDDGVMEKNMYAILRDENRVLGGLYLLSYIWIVIHIILNMLIGFLSVGFSEAQEKAHVDQSFSEELVQALLSLRRAWHIERIKQVMRNYSKGKTTTSLLVHAKEHMIEHHQLLRGEEFGRDDSDTLIRRRGLDHYIGKATMKALGDFYVRELWDEIVMHYGDTKAGKSNQEDQELMQLVADAVDVSVDPAIDKIKTMQNTFPLILDAVNEVERCARLLLPRCDDADDAAVQRDATVACVPPLRPPAAAGRANRPSDVVPLSARDTNTSKASKGSGRTGQTPRTPADPLSAPERDRGADG